MFAVGELMAGWLAGWVRWQVGCVRHFCLFFGVVIIMVNNLAAIGSVGLAVP